MFVGLRQGQFSFHLIYYDFLVIIEREIRNKLGPFFFLFLILKKEKIYELLDCGILFQEDTNILTASGDQTVSIVYYFIIFPITS